VHHDTGVPISGNNDRTTTGERLCKRTEAALTETVSGVLKRMTLCGKSRSQWVRSTDQPEWMLAWGDGKPRSLITAHELLQIGVAVVAKSLGKTHNGRRAAVRGTGNLVCRHQRKIGQVVRDIASKCLLGRTKGFIVSTEAFPECVDIQWSSHAAICFAMFACSPTSF
jgi:hypothetical protein